MDGRNRPEEGMTDSFDLLIRGGNVVLPDVGVTSIDLGISDGRIAAHLAPGTPASAKEVIDVAGEVVLPGVFDPHVHLSYGAPDDVFTETRSAALGGVTTVNSYLRRPSNFLDALPEIQRSWNQLACIDFTISLAITEWRNVAELTRYSKELGVSTFKFFTYYYGDFAHEAGAVEADDALLDALVRSSAELPGSVVCVHAENGAIIGRLQPQVRKSGRQDLAAYAEARPAVAEAESINRSAFFASRAGCPLYVVHISSAEGLREARRQKAQTPGMRLETCPQYLMLSVESPLGTMGKVNPPLRSIADNDALWDGLRDGTIDTVGTDHIAWDRELKSGDIWKAKGSFPGLATMLPILLSEGYHKRGLSLERIVQLTSTNAAQVFGLYPRKGTLLVGSDADLVVCNLNEERSVDPTRLGSRVDYSPYAGLRLKGWPWVTVSRGQVVVRNGEFVGEAGHGRYIARPIDRQE